MSVEDMLDDGEAEPSAAAGAAFLYAYPVEALGEAWDVFGGNARPMIPDVQFGQSIGAPAVDFDALAGGCIFDGVLDQILYDLDQFVPIAGNDERTLDRQVDPAFLLLRHGRHHVCDMTCNL